MPARWRRTVVSITALAIASLLAATSTATAVAPELDEESSARYTLLPDEGLVHVEKRITIKHRKKPTTRMDPCEGDPDQRCEIDVNYFWKAWGPIEVPAEATNVEISVAGGGAQIIEQDDDWVSYVVTFPELHYKQNRKISITYDLPDAEPRSGLDTRVNDAYARFCWYGEPADGGTVSAILPAGYQPRTDGPKVKTRRSAKASTVKRTIRGDPATFYACTEAFQPDRLARTYILGPSQQVVTIDSWRDDPSWRESLLDVVGVDLGALEAVIGSPMPLDELTILEVARNSPFGSPDDFDRKRAQLRVGDDLETPGVATVALARTWFNDQTIADPGLREGLALWSGLTVAGATCPVLAGPADEQTSDPSEWPAAVQRPGSDAARMLERQRAVACALVADTADELGPEAMAAVITSLLTDDAQISLLAAVEAAASADAVAALPSVVPEPD